MGTGTPVNGASTLHSPDELAGKLREEHGDADLSALVEEMMDVPSPASIDPLLGIPRAVPFDAVEPVRTPQGHLIRPLIEAEFDDLCCGSLIVPPRAVAKVHRHPGTNVIVSVVFCGQEGAITAYGDNLQHLVRQYIYDQLPMHAGVHHTVINLSRTVPIIAFEYRASSSVVTDTELSGHLQPIAEDIQAKLTRPVEASGVS